MATTAFGQPAHPRYFAVEVSATVQTSPPEIRLNWPADTEATSYTIRRKSPSDASWGPGTVLPGNAVNYADRDVALGSNYEYALTKATGFNYSGFGYILSGINTQLADTRGKVILIVEKTYAADLASELTRLQQDFVGDGWVVLRHDVSAQDSVTSIKAIIKQDYDADPARCRALLLFGQVPVPYAGDIAPDGHPNHQGAWPADVYYGDMDGSWTDSSVNTRKAIFQENWNVPGDGKFDQSVLPSDLELEVGRVDLSRMTCFSNKSPARFERDLLRQYLNKNHNFRHGLIRAERRALICDNFSNDQADPIAGVAWRNFAPLVGANNVVAVAANGYFPAATSQSYLWSYGSGGGGYFSADGIGTSDDFAVRDVQVVFTMFLGSYFGDWDNESNFLRAPLGSGMALASCYAGFPHWFVHHMALGETIGFGTRLSQNNRNRGLYSPQTESTRQVHMALMGDPTLRMHPVVPPSDLSVTVTSQGIALRWNPSSDIALQGYHVYRGSTSNGPFTRLTGDRPIAESTLADDPPPGIAAYMVRAIKLETSTSGTYQNASQGIFASTRVAARTNATPVNFSNAQLINGNFQISVTGQAGQQFAVEVSTNFVTWSSIFTNVLKTPVFEFSDTNARQFSRRFYRSRLIQ
jgi:hypothetical protein